jgi:hypothetical protein
MFVVVVRAVSEAWRSPSRRGWMIAAGFTLLPIAALLGMGYVLQFRILGRHITPLMAPLLFLLGSGLYALCNGRKIFKWISVAFLALCFISCLSFRFAERHRKDDYRGATALALNELDSGKRVWWAADTYTANYYHLPVSSDPAMTNAVQLVQNLPEGHLKNLEKPDVILISKPDLYDGHGEVMKFISAEKYVTAPTRIPSFTVYHRKPE